MAERDLPVGPALDWAPVAPPGRTPMRGAHAALEPIDPAIHGQSLYDAMGGDAALWTYMSVGPFADYATFEAWLTGCVTPNDPLCFAILDLADGRAKGMASYLRIAPATGVIEIGSIWFGPALQRTPAATEAIYLLARRAFDELGYRRLEWKCDALNAASRRAAKRFGFTYEGEFRQHVVYKGRNRDTAWFAMLDGEWPAIRAGFERWLDPENFDAAGRQITPLR